MPCVIISAYLFSDLLFRINCVKLLTCVCLPWENFMLQYSAPELDRKGHNSSIMAMHIN